MQRLYLAICRRWGPDRMTLSAYAHKLAMAGCTWPRDCIDAIARRWPFRDANHCEGCHQRETSSPTDA